MARVVGLAEMRSLGRSIGEPEGPLPKGNLASALAVLLPAVQSPRARSEAHRGRTLARQHSIWFP